MAGENIRDVSRRRYGRIPEPTDGEKERYSSVKSEKYLHQQEVVDINRLAEAAQVSGDPQILEVALDRYEKLTEEKLSSADQLLKATRP